MFPFELVRNRPGARLAQLVVVPDWTHFAGETRHRGRSVKRAALGGCHDNAFLERGTRFTRIALLSGLCPAADQDGVAGHKSAYTSAYI